MLPLLSRPRRIPPPPLVEKQTEPPVVTGTRRRRGWRTGSSEKGSFSVREDRGTYTMKVHGRPRLSRLCRWLAAYHERWRGGGMQMDRSQGTPPLCVGRGQVSGMNTAALPVGEGMDDISLAVL